MEQQAGASRAKVYKKGKRWHWYLVVQHSSQLAYVYQGDEATWRVAMAMAEFSWHTHVDAYGLVKPPYIVLGDTNRVDTDGLAA